MRDPVREGLAVWAAVIGALLALELVGRAIPVVGQLTGAIAVAAFLYAPIRALEARGQDARDAGWRFDRLGRDLAWALGTCALVLPLFALAVLSAPSWLGQLPAAVRPLLAPYAARGAPHLGWDLAGQVLGHGAVAFSEEFFYRGYLTLRFEARMRPLTAALLAAALFAVGHLVHPAPFRLAVFFPALWYAWLRARTGTIVGAAVAHWLSNVALLVLQNAA